LAAGKDSAATLAGEAIDGAKPRAIRAPPVRPQWGERPMSRNECNAIDALVCCKAEETRLSL
jgi:hypothetical protein